MFIEFIPQMEPILARPVRIEDGAAVVPDVPGHGIEFDETALARYDVTSAVGGEG
jgi:L-alanine-DL-glutamate epimerase-like enolase superfamily enzyme